MLHLLQTTLDLVNVFLCVNVFNCSTDFFFLHPDYNFLLQVICMKTCGRCGDQESLQGNKDMCSNSE